MKLVNRAIDNAQRDLAAQIPKTVRCRRGLRFVLLRARENLGLKGVSLLAELMKINQPLYQAYLLKEQLRTLWSFPSARLAERFLDQWINQAKATGINSFGQLAKTLETHSHSILAWYEHHITTGPLEGLNNKIKTLKRQATDSGTSSISSFVSPSSIPPSHEFPDEPNVSPGTDTDPDSDPDLDRFHPSSLTKYSKILKTRWGEEVRLMVNAIAKGHLSEWRYLSTY